MFFFFFEKFIGCVWHLQYISEMAKASKGNHDEFEDDDEETHTGFFFFFL